MTTPVRITAVLTHPIQYYAPWFRYIHDHAPELALTVVHATQPTPAQQGVGFDHAFEWDISLTEGYRSITVRPAKRDDRIDSGSFTGLDVPEIGGVIAGTTPDVVIITGWYSVTLLRALLACRRLGVPTLNRGDSHLLSGPRGWKRPLWTLKTRLLLRQFDGFLSPGVRVKEYLGWFGVPDHRIFQVPHAVDNQMFAAAAATYQHPDLRAAARRRWSIQPDAFVVLFVGKLVLSKRPLNVVRAVARLAPGATLMVVGSGPLDGAVRAEAGRLGVTLRMAGFLNQSELGEPYGLADCLTLPSDFSETWGLVVNEALACGLPCVVSDAVGCAPDLIHDGETGYRYPLDDIDALALALSKVRDRKATGHEWGPACRALVAAYSYEAMTQGVVRASRSVITRSVGPEPDGDVPQRIVACCGQMVIAGGAERMAFMALGAMTRRGARAHCIVNGWENFRITPLADDIGATWSVGPYRHSLSRRNLTPSTVLRMVVEIVRVSANLLAEVRRLRATHVLVPDFLTAIRNAPALLWLRIRGVSVLGYLQNAPATGRFYRPLWRWCVNPLIDRFVCNSEFTRRELIANGIRANKATIIPNVAPPRLEQWQRGEPRIPGRIIFIGQIIPEKGLDLLLDAVAMLRAGGVDASLDVVGDLDGWEAPAFRGHRAAVRQRAAEADLADAVHFLGWREDIPLIMRRASIHCCPSRREIREAFGLVVLEAKLSGLPSVVGPSGNLPDLVDHRRTGWVCRSDSAQELAEGLRFFLSDAARLLVAGTAARESAEAYSDDRFASAWTSVIGWSPGESICV
jgi:glycosyltransferase involved in cell wall biosynthesis